MESRGLAFTLIGVFICADLASCLLIDAIAWRSSPELYSQFGRALFSHVTNVVFVAPLFLFCFVVYVYQPRPELPPPPPLTWLLVAREGARLVFYALVQSTAFDLLHAVLHTPWLFRHVHSRHHQFKPTIATASFAVHPLEFAGILLCDLAGPSLLPPESPWTLFVVAVVGSVANSAIHGPHSERLSGHYGHHMGEPTHLRAPAVRICLQLAGMCGAGLTQTENSHEPSTLLASSAAAET